VDEPSLWLTYNICPALLSTSYGSMSIFPAAMLLEGLVMLSFAVTDCECAKLMFALIGRVRRILAVAAKWQQTTIDAFTDPYRPELHYMRGPGPKWRQKHAGIGWSIEGRGWTSIRPTAVRANPYPR